MDPTLAGVLVAGLGTLLAWAVAARAAQISRKQTEVALAQTRVAEEQSQLAASALASEWFAQFRVWASEAIDVLSESVYECPADGGPRLPQQDAAVRHCRQRLSALIDRGRLFAPNIAAAGVGDDKPSAYQGFRHGILDPLVAVERVLDGIADVSHFDSPRKAVVHAKREFVSRVQAVLQPRSEIEQVAQLLARTRQQGDPSLGGLLPASDTFPGGVPSILRPTHKRSAT